MNNYKQIGINIQSEKTIPQPRQKQRPKKSKRKPKEDREKNKSLKESPQKSPKILLKDSGLWFIEDVADKDSPKTWLCGQLKILANTRNHVGEAWGRLIEFRDIEEKLHRLAIPMEMLNGDGKELVAVLLNSGLRIFPSKKAREHLINHFYMFDPAKYVRCVATIGWYEKSFVLPDETISHHPKEEVIFQCPEQPDHKYRTAGTLEDWRKNVAADCVGNSRLVFGVSVSLAGPCLGISGDESGGFHLCGPSSTGKTTGSIVGGSAWGGGGDRGFISSWKTTVNGLEATAALHNHTFLCLDEIGLISPEEAGEAAYYLANGIGKSRMTKNITNRRKLEWALLFLSNGEISLADHIATNPRLKVKAGQEIRMLDLPADAEKDMGIFENIHGSISPGEFAQKIMANAKIYYGTAGRAFVLYLSEHWEEAEVFIGQEKKEFEKAHVPKDSSGEIFRAAGRFALVGAAGELATEAGITGWAQGEARQAAVKMFKAWLAQRATTRPGNEITALQQVRNFIEMHGSSRFQIEVPQHYGNEGQGDMVIDRIPNRAGWRPHPEVKKEQGLYFFLPQPFRTEACCGFDHIFVLKLLEKYNCLKVNDEGRHTLSRRFPESGLTRVYCIDYLALCDVLDRNENVVEMPKNASGVPTCSQEKKASGNKKQRGK